MVLKGPERCHGSPRQPEDWRKVTGRAEGSGSEASSWEWLLPMPARP